MTRQFTAIEFAHILRTSEWKRYNSVLSEETKIIRRARAAFGKNSYKYKVERDAANQRIIAAATLLYMQTGYKRNDTPRV